MVISSGTKPAPIHFDSGAEFGRSPTQASHAEAKSQSQKGAVMIITSGNARKNFICIALKRKNFTKLDRKAGENFGGLFRSLIGEYPYREIQILFNIWNIPFLMFFALFQD
ncbi:hypothetical protein [Leptospira stimsonii]|uniref:hypothetical protein n=1 Tax=Leptospira stimsonii TaxID=2202203 RepID=UPI0014384AAC|nr:hypothetical protein [Leptospira stimsonii]